MLEQPLSFLPLLMLLHQLVQVHGDSHLVRLADLDHGVPLPLAQPLNQFLGGLAYHPGTRSWSRVTVTVIASSLPVRWS